jgi:phosphohistidine phosphatase
MVVYVLRHGIAEDAAPGGSDGDRELTKQGKEKLRNVLTCAREAGVRPGVMLTSPLRRAVQTAKIAAAVLKAKGAPVETKTLLPGASPLSVWSEVRGYKTGEALLAGHEPQLSELVGLLLGCPALLLDLKKGALVCLDVETTELRPHGTLKWILTPKLADGWGAR